MRRTASEVIRELEMRVTRLEKSASEITPDILDSLAKGQKISITYRDSLSGDRETTFEVGPARNGVVRLYPIRDGKPVKKGIATYKLKLRGERVTLVHGDSVVKVLSFKDRVASVRRIASGYNPDLLRSLYVAVRDDISSFDREMEAKRSEMDDDLSFVAEVGKRQVAGQSPSSQEGMRLNSLLRRYMDMDPPTSIEEPIQDGEVYDPLGLLREDIDEEKPTGKRVYPPHTKGEELSVIEVTCPVCGASTKEDYTLYGLFYPGMAPHQTPGLETTSCAGRGYHSDELTSSQIERARKLNKHRNEMILRLDKLKTDLKRGKIKARQSPKTNAMYLSHKNYPTVQHIIDSMKFYQASYDGDNFYLNGESYPIISNKGRWEIDPYIPTSDFIGNEIFEANGGRQRRVKL